MTAPRLSTGDVLDLGILNRTSPKSTQPAGLNLHQISDRDWLEDEFEEELARWLQEGGVRASMYYGVFGVWKTEKGYSGELFQYRELKDSFTDASFEYAFGKASDWSSSCSE